MLGYALLQVVRSREDKGQLWLVLHQVAHIGKDRTRQRLLLEILAPNFRPAQVTDDLGGFWTRTYPELKKELKRRYPKHEWR